MGSHTGSQGSNDDDDANLNRAYSSSAQT